MATLEKELKAKVVLDQTGFQQGITSLNRSLRLIQSEFKAASASLTPFGTGTDALKVKADSLSRQIDVQRQKVDALDAAHKKSVETKGADAKQTENLEIRLNKAKAELAGMETELKKTNTEIDRQSNSWLKLSESCKTASEKMKKVGDSMAKVGKEATMKVTLPILGLGAAAIKSSIDFESAFTNVIKTVDATEAEIEQLRGGFKQMSRDLPLTTEEIYNIGAAAGQLGIETKHIMSFTEVMGKLGVTTNLSSDQAATALARLANIVQMPQDQFDRLGATVVALGNNLATTEAEIVEMALRIAGAGKTIGMTEAQILAFAGSLSSVGMEAQAGGSSISKVMISIANEVASGGKKLGEFARVAGMSVEEFRKAFQEDAAGAIITFIEGLGTLHGAGENVFGILEDLGMSEVRVRDAMLRASGAGDLFRKSLELGSKAWEENLALNKEAELRFGTTASQLQLLQNEAKLAAAEFGDAMVPVLLDLVNTIKPLIRSFAELSLEKKKTIITIAALVAAFGPVVNVMGNLVRVGSSVTGTIGKISAKIGEYQLAGKAAGTVTSKFAAGLPAVASGVGTLALPLGVAAAAIGLYAYEFNRVSKMDLRSHSEAVQDALDEIKNTFAETRLSTLISDLEYQTDQINQEIAHLEALDQLTVDESARLEKLYEERRKISEQNQRARHVQEIIAEEKFQKEMGKATRAGNEDVVKAFNDMKSEKEAAWQDYYNKEAENLTYQYVVLGNISEREYRNQLRELDKYTGEMITESNKGMGEWVKQHETKLKELGLVS